MHFDVITLFPEMFSVLGASKIWQNAIDQSKLSLTCHQLRDFSSDPLHCKVDDTPYGGGAGMVIKVEPLVKAVQSIARDKGPSEVWMMSPQGDLWAQSKVSTTKKSLKHIILVCGRYEGVDERFIQRWVDRCMSIGDYVLSGGELAAMVVMESLSRAVDGVLGDFRSFEDDTFESGMLKYPQYTKPRIFEGLAVPEVLLSGNHGEIAKWRAQQSYNRTLQKRPDLLKDIDLLPIEDLKKTS